MTWIVVALVLLALSVVILAYTSRRKRRRTSAPVVAPELAARLAAVTPALAAAAPWRPAAAPDAPAVAAAIEAALIARDPRRALDLAEAALAAAPESGDGALRVWLAWALCANAQPRAALDQLAKAGDAGGALAAYVAARAAHLHFEHGHGAVGALPPLITTGDLAIVTLGRGRGSATWLAGATDVQLSAAQVQAAIAEHRSVTARCLAGALDALDRAPGFVDAAYLAARLAVKAGQIGHAATLFTAIASRMLGRPDADAFERDREDLSNPTRAVAAAKQKPKPIDRGQRSPRLRVLP